MKLKRVEIALDHIRESRQILTVQLRHILSLVAKADLGYTPRNSPARFFRRLGQIKTHGVHGSEDCASGTNWRGRFQN